MQLQTSTDAFQLTQSVVALRILPKSKCFLYSVTIQRTLGFPLACKEAVIYLSTLENTLKKRPSRKGKIFYGLALTHRKQSFFVLHGLHCF